MINSCAVVVSLFKGLKGAEHLSPDVNCLTFPIGNIDQAVKQTVKLFENPVLMESISKKGEENVFLNFTDKIIGAKWNRALRLCTNNSNQLSSNIITIIKNHSNIEKYKEYIRFLLHYKFPHETA